MLNRIGGRLLKYGFMLFAISLISSSANSQQSIGQFSIGEQYLVNSGILDEQRPIIIDKPTSYDRSIENYPVIFLLDGAAHFHHASGVVKFLAGANRIPEMLVVGIPNTNRGRDLSYPTNDDFENAEVPSNGGAENFEQFIISELIPWVDENFRTSTYKILVGHSLGGLFTVTTLLNNPDYFNAYIAISPNLNWNHSATLNLAADFFIDNSELEADLFLAVGNENASLVASNWRLAAILNEIEAPSFKWNFEYLPNESHQSIPLRGLYKGLEAIFPNWEISYAEALTMFEDDGTQATEQLANRYRNSSNRMGYDRNIPGNLIWTLTPRLLRRDLLDEAASLLLYDTQANTPPSQYLNDLAFKYMEINELEKAKEIFLISANTHPGNLVARESLEEMDALDGLSIKPEVNLSQDKLAMYEGTYRLQTGAVMEILIRNEELVRVLFGSEETLFPLSEQTFYRQNDDAIYHFNVDQSGAVNGLVIDQGIIGLTPGTRVD